MSAVFTVITVSYNSAATLQRTIDSVLGQSLRELEYWVIDGGSNDGTLDILKACRDSRLHWLSEPDQGLYHAMNKGLARARGRYVALLNSDDLFADDGVLEMVAETFAGAEDCVVYGDLEFFNGQGETTRRWRAGEYSSLRWRQGWHPPHPATFLPRAVYSRYGEFDTTLRLSADYKLMLKLGLAGVEFRYLPRLLTRMQQGGASTSGLRSSWRHNRESFRAWRQLGETPPWLLVPRKLLFKLKAHRDARWS